MMGLWVPKSTACDEVLTLLSHCCKLESLDLYAMSNLGIAPHDCGPESPLARSPRRTRELPFVAALKQKFPPFAQVNDPSLELRSRAMIYFKQYLMNYL